MFAIDRPYDDVQVIDYDAVDNVFYDDEGFRIVNILDIISPTDLFLFKNDYDINFFVHRTIPNTVVILNLWGEEVES